VCEDTIETSLCIHKSFSVCVGGGACDDLCVTQSLTVITCCCNDSSTCNVVSLVGPGCEYMGCVCEDMCTNYKTFVCFQQTASKTGKPQEAGTGSVRLDMRLCEEEGGGVLWGHWVLKSA